jgi:2-phosphosulfolactate phosphatase
MEHAGEVLLASFANARATADYIRGRNPREVSIVAMGVVGSFRTPEDEFCGDYIESMLAGTPYDHAEALHAIIADESAQKFLRGDRDCYPREDAVICLQRDMFDTVLRAERRGDHIESVRIGGAGRAGETSASE